MLDSYSGATRLHVIIGDPIAQVKAPGGLTREFGKRGRDWIVVPLQLTTADVGAGLSVLSRARNVDGLIATVPHKFALASHCSTLSDRAGFLGAANVARRNADGSWHGDMLDGEGFTDAAARVGCRMQGARALLIGAGGAGSAIALSLLDRGVAKLAIHDIDTDRRAALLAKLADRFGDRIGQTTGDASNVDLLVNATPMGMRADDPLPLDIARLDAATFVGDVITVPEITPLLAAARERGCAIQTGIGMFESNIGLMADFFEGGASQ
ncbi:shikimate dehydrogenase family protein [Bradyrhizobium sp.]|uniref:shikimate dehydrogenase family protein n=1 Tax=Bradyrhizobium sp. TaxID=376 RepID=UPI0025BE45A5|nr:shikimate dehydrogenase [Bradyrhizobium sp.]MBV8920722.1 shikimate dehydrogenase [Bradyrhizobium sp.]